MEKAFIYMRKIFNLFLEILFPSKCLGCRLRNEILCDSCVDKFLLVERETENNILAVYDYRDDIVKKAIWKLKYYHSPYLGQRLGQLLYKALIEEIIEIQMFSLGLPILVIPVPISHDRKKGRGYNQSEIIAKSFCEASPKNIFELRTNIIFKKTETLPQAKLTNRNKRLKNIKGAFDIKNKEYVVGRTVIIIDDVTTTGGTMLEIMKVLKKHGAKKVVGFAVAH